MKYLAYSLILIAFSASMFGQTKTVTAAYTHYETTADPKNGQSCVANTAYCVGGGTSTSVIPSPDGCIPAKTLVTVTPGTYSNFIKGRDNDMSTLSSVLYTVRRKSDNAKIYEVTLSKGANWPTSPTTFTANLLVSPSTTGVPGSYYKSGDGILTITSPSIPGSAVSNSDALIVTIDPTCSPTAGVTGSTYTSVGGVDETFTQEFGATAVAAMSKTGKLIPGDVKYSELTTDHDGWYLMNGRNISSITNVSAQQAASAIFSSTLPDMNNKYFIADRSGGDRMTNIGQNSFTVENNNIEQSGLLSTQTDGAHTHSVNTGNYGLMYVNGLETIGSSRDDSWYEANLTVAPLNSWTVNSNGSSHSHQFRIGTASPSSIDNRPTSKKMYAFVYLGE